MIVSVSRLRRGKMVVIPNEHVGNVTTHKTIADRKIKAKCKRLERRKRLIKERNDHLSTYVIGFDPSTEY